MRSWVACSLLLCFAISAKSNVLQSNECEFHYYSRDNPTLSHPMQPTAASVMTSPFSMTQRTIITIHDRADTVGGNFNAFVVSSALYHDNYNILAIDWSAGCSTYTVGLSNAPLAGQYIATFVNLLINSFSYNPALITLVGVGLGGHIAGIAARNSAGNIAHIVALNPSLHGWSHHSQKLSESDADLVETLYTTAGITGYDRSLGHFNFYSNGGTAQTGCFADVECSEMMSYIYYSESLTTEITNGPKFMGSWCDSYEDALSNQCAGGASRVAFGGTEPKDGPPGVYSFSTNAVQPFAHG